MREWLDQLPNHEPTPEEIQAEKDRLEAIIEEQSRCLPEWWFDDVPVGGRLDDAA